MNPSNNNNRFFQDAQTFASNLWQSATETLGEIGRSILTPPVRELRSVSTSVPIIPWHSVQHPSMEERSEYDFNWQGSSQINEFLQWFATHNEMSQEPVPRPLPESSRSNIKIHNKPDLVSRTGDSDNSTCSICLESLQQGISQTNTVSELPCGHCFHTSCIDKWFVSSPECPVCRRDIRDFTVNDPSQRISVRVRHRSGEVKSYIVLTSENVSELASQMPGGTQTTVFLHLGKNIQLNDTFLNQDIQEGDLLVEWVKS